MRHLTVMLLTYLALAVQAASGDSLALGGCRLPLVWLPVVVAVAWFADARGIAWGALIGLLADGLSAGMLGQQMLAATLAATLLLPLLPESRSRFGVARLVWTFALIASAELLSQFHASLLSDGPAVTNWSLVLIAGSAAYGTTMCALLTSIGRTVLPLSGPLGPSASGFGRGHRA
jgi:rod shape-determining protein MreD